MMPWYKIVCDDGGGSPQRVHFDNRVAASYAARLFALAVEFEPYQRVRLLKNKTTQRLVKQVIKSGPVQRPDLNRLLEVVRELPVWARIPSPQLTAVEQQWLAARGVVFDVGRQDRRYLSLSSAAKAETIRQKITDAAAARRGRGRQRRYVRR